MAPRAPSVNEDQGDIVWVRGDLDKMEARQDRFEERLASLEATESLLIGKDGKGGQLGNLEKAIDGISSIRYWVAGQAIGILVLLVVAAVALYSRITALETHFEDMVHGRSLRLDSDEKAGVGVDKVLDVSPDLVQPPGARSP